MKGVAGVNPSGGIPPCAMARYASTTECMMPNSALSCSCELPRLLKAPAAENKRSQSEKQQAVRKRSRH
jgi:hypothetical protein